MKAVEGNEEKGEFSGYGSISGNKDLGNDIVVEGAFAKSIARKGAKSVKLLYQHKADEPIGVFDEILEDSKGLAVKGRLAMGTQRGREVFELMEISAVTFPMNPKARVEMVKGEDKTVREWEEIMRDAGSLSRNEAKVAATAVTKALSNRDDCSDHKPEVISSIENLTNILKPQNTE